MWEINVNDQTITFLLSLAFGVVLCTIYDVARALNKNGGGVLTVFFRDIFFWIICAPLTFLFLLSRTNGEIRGYVLIAAVIGFVICRFTLSRFVFPLLCLFFRFFKRISALFSDATERFSVFIIRLLENISKKTVNFFKLVLKSLKKLLKSVRQLLYTNQDKKTTRKALDGCETET